MCIVLFGANWVCLLQFYMYVVHNYMYVMPTRAMHICICIIMYIRCNAIFYVSLNTKICFFSLYIVSVLSSVRQLHNLPDAADHVTFVGHPVNALSLIKRFATQWRVIWNQGTNSSYTHSKHNCKLIKTDYMIYWSQLAHACNYLLHMSINLLLLLLLLLLLVPMHLTRTWNDQMMRTDIQYNRNVIIIFWP